MKGLNRREMLAAMAATAGGVLLPGRARAVSAADLKFVFVFANGGWDPTRVFYSGFSNKSVEMEDSAEAYTLGDLNLVDHPDRESVRTFFENHFERTVVINGMQIPAIDHFTCQTIATTGSSSGTRPDWAATLAYAAGDRYSVPQLLLGGPSYPSIYGTAVVRCGANGQLVSMVSGDKLPLGNTGGWTASAAGAQAVDEWLNARIDGLVSGSHAESSAMFEAFQSTRERALVLRESVPEINLEVDNSLESYVDTTLRALSMGLSRVVSFEFPSAYDGGNWDSHDDNDAEQSSLFTLLFDGLNDLMDGLAAQPGIVGKTMADETVLVVFSEMGRPPIPTMGGGKGHWPYTSVLLVGPGLDGGRTVGDYDTSYSGAPIVVETGEVDEDYGETITATHFGATLQALGDVDPEETIPGASPITGILT